MAGEIFPFAAGRGLAMARAAEAMLRALGGGEVQLRSVTGFSDSGNPRLGIGVGSTTDVTFAPVVVNKVGRDQDGAFELLFPAAAVQVELEKSGCETAQELFAKALGIAYDGTLLRVRRVETELHAGTPYLFRVTAAE